MSTWSSSYHYALSYLTAQIAHHPYKLMSWLPHNSSTWATKCQCLSSGMKSCNTVHQGKWYYLRIMCLTKSKRISKLLQAQIRIMGQSRAKYNELQFNWMKRLCIHYKLIKLNLLLKILIDLLHSHNFLYAQTLH
jgi:hypothetical protein